MEEKKYQVIMQDEYNNLYHLGFYENLKESIDDVNAWLEIYDVSIDELVEYASTFCMCFDRDIETPDGTWVMVRGFIFN